MNIWNTVKKRTDIQWIILWSTWNSPLCTRRICDTNFENLRKCDLVRTNLVNIHKRSIFAHFRKLCSLALIVDTVLIAISVTSENSFNHRISVRGWATYSLPTMFFRPYLMTCLKLSAIIEEMYLVIMERICSKKLRIDWNATLHSLQNNDSKAPEDSCWIIAIEFRRNIC